MSTTYNDKVRPAGTGRTSEASLRRATAMSTVLHRLARVIAGRRVTRTLDEFNDRVTVLEFRVARMELSDAIDRLDAKLDGILGGVE